MGEQKLAGDVANGPNSGDTGGHALVNFDKTALVGFDAHGLEADVGGVGLKPDGDEGLVGFEHFFAVCAGDFDFDAFIAAFNGEDARAGEDLDAALGVDFGEFVGHFFVFGGQDVGQHFDDGDFAAVAVPNGGKFDADGAAADDDHVFGARGLEDGFAVGENALAVNGDARNGHGIGPGGDDDVFGADFLDLAFGVGDADFVFGEQFGRAHDDINLVLAHQGVNAGGETLGHIAAAFNCDAEIKLEIVERDAKFSGALAQSVSQFGIFEEGLGRHTAHVQADAAKPLLFNHGDFQAQLRGANGTDITARPGADDYDIVR